MGQVRATIATRVILGLLTLVLSGAAARGAELRELSTDRPDTTESPFTVDRGHVQIELSFAEWTRDKEHLEEATSWSAVGASAVSSSAPTVSQTPRYVTLTRLEMSS